MANPFNVVPDHHLLNFPGLSCPISGRLMTDPAILAGTGMSYERSAIVAHLARYGTDPDSGDVLNASARRLLPNPALKGLIDLVMEQIGNVAGQVDEEEEESEADELSDQEDVIE
jgi:hypothetical protein